MRRVLAILLGVATCDAAVARTPPLPGGGQRFPQSATVGIEPAGPHRQGSYKISGARALRPSRMSEDGARTYIEWPATVPLPAVYVRDATGRESLTNGNMRDGLYVIDSVEERFLFRLDGKVAQAVRLHVDETSR